MDKLGRRYLAGVRVGYADQTVVDIGVGAGDPLYILAYKKSAH